MKSEPAVLPQAENPICQQPPEIDFQQHLALLKRQQQSEQSIRIQQQQQPQPTIHQLQPEISILKQEQPPQPDEKQLQTEQQPLLQQHEKVVQQQHQDSELNLQILSHPLPVHEVDVIVQSEQQQQQTHIQFQSVLQQPCQQQQQSELQQPLYLKANAEDQPQPQQQIAPHRKDQLDQSVEVGLKAAEPEDDTSDYRFRYLFISTTTKVPSLIYTTSSIHYTVLVFVFVKPNKNKFISIKPNSNLNHFQQLLFHTMPPPLDQYKHLRKRAPKLLLGRQNWATSKGGATT